MDIKRYDNIKETLFLATLPNGLEIRVIPRPGYSRAFAAFGTNYGGADRRFRLREQFIDTPAGVAHFLEHKMFDMPDGNNALRVLSESGAQPNAFTSDAMTCYYFDCTEGFYENLNMLLSFVSTPYFTPESVQKEQGIIGQEIRMYDDSPDLRRALYHAGPLRDSVAGTIGSIAEITDKTLYDCHSAFYAPSNMCLSVVGDVDPARVETLAEELLPKERAPVPEPDYGEPPADAPAKTEASAAMEVSQPQFLFGSKFRPASTGPALLRQKLTASLALTALIGRSSDFYTSLYAKGLLSSDFEFETDYSGGSACVIAGGESREPKKVLESFSAEVEKVLKNGLNEDVFKRVKRMSYGQRLRSLDDFDSLAVSLVDGCFGGWRPLDAFEALEGISASECADFIGNALAPQKLALSVITPVKG